MHQQHVGVLQHQLSAISRPYNAHLPMVIIQPGTCSVLGNPVEPLHMPSSFRLSAEEPSLSLLPHNWGIPT